jgi:hypothetical protein
MLMGELLKVTQKGLVGNYAIDEVLKSIGMIWRKKLGFNTLCAASSLASRRLSWLLVP